ncbi:hypothetical protein [Mangrovibacterium lignilyticum]|uniref:hypothetical protein n=1 Tax=Mangrovibacterium lignilyticum TaxID=2668052 RepID=UPI0013D05034|nr:hypothetical protein [Mangrovibacterium lignilyticum]
MRAIEAALEKGKRVPMKDLAFSYLSLEKLQAIYPRLSGSIRQLNSAKQNQFDKSREYGEIFKKAKLYLSHFVQVMTFAIIREEMKPDIRAFYGLEVNSQRLPALNLEKDVLEWGERIIKGEQQRCMKGGSPIYSPSIALVKVHFESFIEAYRHQKMLQNITNRASEQMNQVRDEADKLIQEVWNEVEERFNVFSEDVKREKATDYGVTYVYRPAELKKMEADKLQTNLF